MNNFQRIMYTSFYCGGITSYLPKDVPEGASAKKAICEFQEMALSSQYIIQGHSAIKDWPDEMEVGGHSFIKVVHKNLLIYDRAGKGIKKEAQIEEQIKEKEVIKLSKEQITSTFEKIIEKVNDKYKDCMFISFSCYMEKEEVLNYAFRVMMTQTIEDDEGQDYDDSIEAGIVHIIIDYENPKIGFLCGFYWETNEVLPRLQEIYIKILEKIGGIMDLYYISTEHQKDIESECLVPFDFKMIYTTINKNTNNEIHYWYLTRRE